MSEKQKASQWVVYIVKCSDERLYTGITNDLAQRIEAHNNGVGARFTRGRRPVKLFYQEKCADRSSATRREMQIKRLSRDEKLLLAAGKNG